MKNRREYGKVKKIKNVIIVVKLLLKLIDVIKKQPEKLILKIAPNMYFISLVPITKSNKQINATEKKNTAIEIVDNCDKCLFSTNFKQSK